MLGPCRLYNFQLGSLVLMIIQMGASENWEEIREDVWVWLVCEGGGGTLTCVGERSSSCLTYGGTPGSSLPLSSSHATQISPILMKVLGVNAEDHKGPS